jgi:hypothetical protein
MLSSFALVKNDQEGIMARRGSSFFCFAFARYTGTPGLHAKWYSVQSSNVAFGRIGLRYSEGLGYELDLSKKSIASLTHESGWGLLKRMTKAQTTAYAW